MPLRVVAPQPAARSTVGPAPPSRPSPIRSCSLPCGAASTCPAGTATTRARRPTVAQLQALREKGFTHIRLLLDESRIGGEEREAYLDRMFEQIILLFSLDYAVSLDLHAGGIFERGASDAEAQLLDLWRAIANRVRSLDPEKLAVELLNEPQTDSATWWPVAARLAAEIRRILPDHTIVVGPAGPQRHETLAGLEPLGDRNIVYAIHYYDPFAFTHQGADWGGADDPIRYLREPAVSGERRRSGDEGENRGAQGGRPRPQPQTSASGRWRRRGARTRWRRPSR